MPTSFASLAEALRDRYVLERELGRGGMATVYLARDLKHDRLVAVKVLRPEVAAALGPERFLREIKIASSLTHPHILPLHDSGESEGLLYYVMPFIAGETLRDRLVRRGAVPLLEALEIARNVASALAYAHVRGIVHRDIKPANILLEGSEAVVADFGIARAVSAAAGDQISEPGLAIGTPAYMSPEQAAGGKVDERSDVYSLGCVLYEMLAGEPPFTGPTAQVIGAKHMQQPVPSIRVTRPTVPPEIDALIRTALGKAPADRYADAAQFATALETQAGGIRRRLPGRWLSAAVVGLLAAGVLAVGTRWAWRRSEGSGQASLPRSAQLRPDPKQVAVLFFESEEAPELQLVANGLTQDLIDELGQVEGLQVVSADGVRPYRDRPVPLDSIVAALSVGTLVAGTVGGTPERPWLVVRLIDAATGRQLDSKRLGPAGGDVLALRSELVQEVTRFLRERLGREIRLKELRAGAREPRAWLLVRRAEDLREDAATLYAAGDTGAARNALDAADSLLRVVERLDPDWVDPTLLRGWIAADRIDLAEGTTAPVLQQWAPEGMAHAERALARRPGYPPALELRGYLRLLGWQYADRSDPNELTAAERDVRAAAVPENPSQARAWSILSAVLEQGGSFAEANLAAKRAYETDAFLAAAPAVLFRLYLTSLMLRRWNEAADWCARGHSRFPNHWRFSYCRLTLLSMPSGQRPDVAAAWRLTAELERVTSPSERPVLAPRWRMLVAGVLARAGQHDSARRTAHAARTAAGDDREIDYYQAGVHLLLGEHERALRLLQRYIAYSPQSRLFLKGDPLFEPLHSDARFAGLVTDPDSAMR